MGRKGVVPIAACFRAACDHPFLVVMLCFLAFLYRSFPCVFSLLLSAFPVVFCTFVLLGVLLIHSQPQTRRDEKRIDTAVQFETVLPKDERSQELQFGRSMGELSGAGSDLLGKENSEVQNDKCASSCDSTSESSSSDVEIVPFLDELHPLLHEGTPEPMNLSLQDDYGNEDSVTDSEDSTGDQTESQVEDDAKIQGAEDYLTKSAIKWTEEDEKNVMEVGSSELERNQLLERVMERRKSRKCVSMVAVNEFSNMETCSPQNSVPHIVTRRHNPFDNLPDDTYEQQGLPSIPGSAPSVLVPRQNPFDDIPYYLNEERDHTSRENSQLDFLDFQTKDTFFHRSETFSVAPYESCLFPVYTHSNASKSSSAPETDSVGSVEDLEDKNVIKEEIEEKKLVDEPVLTSKMEHVTEHVGHGSQSSEEDEEEEEESSDSGMRNILVDEIVMKLETLQQNNISSGSICSSPSSSSSSSEASERIFVVKEKKQPSVENNGISRQSSLEGSEPVYDISPPRVRRNFSSSSIVFDLHEPWFPPVQVKRTVSFAEGVIMMGSNREPNIMSFPIVKEKTLRKSSLSQQPVDEHHVSKPFLDTTMNDNQGDDDKEQLSSTMSESDHPDTQESSNEIDKSGLNFSTDQEVNIE
ncbi:hypothetical protein DM860_015252 [Cuscuta australis]|uniref:Uncharacterized protein n=1 Tax=Cuscuta australis TaxID=267555 RepID=A0A328D3A9_9ASTE|nr:hypothetical protein DM860_015252 [Cuscuta australis]